MNLRTTRRALFGLCLLAAGSPGLHAAEPPAKPLLGQPGKDVMWLPSPDAAVDRMLRMAQVRSGDLLVDLGAGDGKIAIAAVRSHGARAIGLEYNPALVTVAARNAEAAGVGGRATFRQADIFEADFSDATVVTMYLLPELNLRLRPTLFAMRPGTRIVSHSFDMGDWQPDERAQIGTARVMAWKIPANAAGEWTLAPGKGVPGAPWTLRLRQKFQQLEGEAVLDKLEAGLVQPRLSGDAVSFSVRSAGGGMLHFSGRIQGDRMAGTVARDGRGRQAFSAVRTTEAPPIAGVAATEQETARAQRALESGS